MIVDALYRISFEKTLLRFLDKDEVEREKKKVH